MGPDTTAALAVPAVPADILPGGKEMTLADNSQVCVSLAFRDIVCKNKILCLWERENMCLRI